jgi:hypothetical protein
MLHCKGPQIGLSGRNDFLSFSLCKIANGYKPTGPLKAHGVTNRSARDWCESAIQPQRHQGVSLMRTLRIEMHRGHGWQLRAEGKIRQRPPSSRSSTTCRITRFSSHHSALIDGAEVAMAGAEVKQRRDAPDDLLAS